MQDFFVGVFWIISILLILLWFMVIGLGGAEIVWWIFTGDFFHFVSEAAPISTF